MSRQQKSKKSRTNKKEAKYAGLRTNTAHPSHLSMNDTKAIREYWEKWYGDNKNKEGKA